MANWLMNSLGLIVLATAMVATAFAAFGYAVEVWGRKVEQNRDVYRELAAREVGTRIVKTCHRFSEDPAAMEAVKAVGEQLQEGGYWFDVDAARDRWRKAVRTDGLTR